MGVLRSNQSEKTKGRSRCAKPGDERYLALIRQITDERATYDFPEGHCHILRTFCRDDKGCKTVLH